MKKYYGIIFLKNGDACICSACDSEDEVFETLKTAIEKRVEHIDKIKGTSYITREVKEGEKAPTLQNILGSPRSRDIMQNKKIMKSILKGALA